MEKVNAYTFYEIARELGQVHSLADNVSTRDAVIPIMNARNRMKSLLRGEPIPLSVSLKLAADVADTLEGLWDSFTVDDGAGGKRFQWPTQGQNFEPWQLSWYRNALEKFETVFSAEMGEAATYFVPRRGIYHTTALVDSAEETFPSEVAQHVPEKTKLEWRSAGRCLAFNLCSASGFHVARAVEGTMEIYYQTFVGKEPGEITWGTYLVDLEKNVTGREAPSEKTLAAIRQMKDDYRNPLMHPRVVLSESDARMLFANGESLIIAMASEIRQNSENGVQGSFAGMFSTPTKGA